jgi:tetratricopeptide (TPR) repeat protein
LIFNKCVNWLLILLVAVFLSACGYHDNLHTQHHQLWLMWNSQFDELEQSLDEQYALLKKSKLKSKEFSKQIQAFEYADGSANTHFEDFINVKPNSKWAQAFYAKFLIRQAANARGDQYAVDTPDTSMDKMHEIALKAVKQLEIARANQAPMDLYASAQLTANRLLNVDTPDEDLSLVHEAMARDGYTWSAPLSYFQSLYPQWGGSEQAMMAFIKDVKSSNPKLASALSADFYWRRGLDFSVQGDVEQSIQAYEKAIQFYPDSMAINNLAGKYVQTGRCDEAIKVYERNLAENDEWDLYTLESLMQAHQCAGNEYAASRVNKKRQELFSRYQAGE